MRRHLRDDLRDFKIKVLKFNLKPQSGKILRLGSIYGDDL